jgi:hypothetical protein
MFIRMLCLVGCLLAFSGQAGACRYEARPLEESLAAAKTAFVGTVRTVENRLAVIVAEKAVRGIEPGQTIDVDIGRESCDIRFEPGQRWLFLGPGQPSGSLLLQDEYGRVVEENLKAVAAKLGDDLPRDGAEVLRGTLERSCAPWDGAAFTILLDNRLSASVYASPLTLDKQGTQIASYPADGKSERDHASIVQCPRPRDGQAEDLPCRSAQGTIYIGSADEKEVTGAIEVNEGEYHSRHVFRVKWIHKQVFCG